MIGNYKYVKLQKEKYYTSQNINKLIWRLEHISDNTLYWFITNIQRFVSLYDGQQGGYKIEDIKNHEILIPIINGDIAFDYMETYIKELEAYLIATGLEDYILTEEERESVELFRQDKIDYSTFNVKKLFGKSTRGKRLKSVDRTKGKLPFVTAGEVDNGISAFVGNKVNVFDENTVTIDMFGSAKYRNYQYGGDDHITVVHTGNLPKYSSIFTATALNKASNTGQFDYSRNFYAKDADELLIQLPVTSAGNPDYELMNCYIHAIEKMVIKGVIEWKDKQIEATKSIVLED